VSRCQRAPQVRFTKRCAIAALRVRRETQELYSFVAYTARAWGKSPAVSGIAWVPPPPHAGPRFQGGCLQHGGLYHSTSKRAFIGLLVTHICSSIGLFTAVREFPFRGYLSLTCLSSDHRHCNRLFWSKPTMWTTIPQCGNAPQRLSTEQTRFVVLPRLRSTALQGGGAPPLVRGTTTALVAPAAARGRVAPSRG